MYAVQFFITSEISALFIKMYTVQFFITFRALCSICKDVSDLFDCCIMRPFFAKVINIAFTMTKGDIGKEIKRERMRGEQRVRKKKREGRKILKNRGGNCVVYYNNRYSSIIKRG